MNQNSFGKSRPEVTISIVSEAWEDILYVTELFINTCGDNLNIRMVSQKSVNSSLTTHKVDESNVLGFNSKLNKVSDGHAAATSSSKHGVKDKDVLFLVQVIRELLVKENRFGSLFISLYQDLSTADVRHKVKHGTNHRVASSNDRDSTVFRLFMFH
jgi:hypothetical protein